MALVRRKKTEADAPSPGALLEYSARLTKASSEAETWKKREGDAKKLLERREALQQYKSALARLSAAIQALRTVKSLKPAVSSAVQRLTPHRRAAEKLVQRCRADTASITQAKALEGLRVSDFEDIEAALLTAWLAYAGAEEQSGVEVVLEKFPKLRGAAKTVSAARAALNKEAEVLPRSTASIAACETARKKLAEAMANVEEGGIDTDTLDFLRSSFTGVSLDKVLSNKRILSWIQDNDLANQFVVRSR
ncbi:hypothetical protein [Anaeromyxobacter paludicola]|nr:hypothetical protein [Anaeromyxobacter paludicola]